MTRHARQRLRIALLVISCLLFQQAALAAYFCPMEQMPAQISAMAEHCDGMGVEQARDNLALCAKHCNPDHAATADAAKLSVPPLALPALAFASMLVQPALREPGRVDVPIARSDPPPRLQYCSLLI